jgi:hypothetical protein
MAQESSIDFRHWLEDFASSFPDLPSWEACLVELIANSLDAKCGEIHICANEAQRTIEVWDNGNGMTEPEFVDYHNLAVSPKQKGQGIGFAGLGAKLGVWLSTKVVTETKSKGFHSASVWWLEGKKLLWDYIPQRTLTKQGTKTTLLLKQRYPLLKRNELLRIIQEHYYALFDPVLSQIHRQTGIYPIPIQFWVNGERVTVKPIFENANVEVKQDFVFQAKDRRSTRVLGHGYFLLMKEPVEEDGVSVSTWGKTIKKGEWFRQYPSDMGRIQGFIEAPYLVRSLTVNKCGFVAEGREGKNYRHFYRQMQKLFGDWLDRTGKVQKKPTVSKDAEELERLTADILFSLPELHSIFARPGSREIPIPDIGGEGRMAVTGAQKVKGTEGGPGHGEGVDVYPGADDDTQVPGLAEGDELTAKLRRRRVPLGPKIAWLDDGQRDELAWVSGDTIFINSGHSAYQKAVTSRLDYYHNLVSIALALVQEKGAEAPREALGLVSKFFVTWGKMP